jgi:uncharacterized protein YecE (DUF72 family)
MDFGKVNDLSKVDFTLPDDHPDTVKLFKSLNRKKSAPKVYVGCAKWGRKEWIGPLYPKALKIQTSLNFIRRISIASSSMRCSTECFRDQIVEKWASFAGPDFRFAPKMPQIVTHIRRLKNAEADTDAVLDSMSGFGDKIGHTFLQFDDRFGPENLELLHDYLRYLPKDFKVTVEWRHKDWFADTAEGQEGFEMLREMNVPSVITDTAGRRDVLHMRLTAPVAFIRFVGNDMHQTDFTRIDDWVDRMTEVDP